MKNLYKKQILVLLLAIFTNWSFAQVITTSPSFPTETDAITITFNATQGTGGLANYAGDVYAHTGVITDKSASDTDWKYVVAAWDTNLPKAKLTRISTNTYTLAITGNVRSFYGVPVGEKIKKIALVFRNSTGSLTGKDVGGKDIYATIYEAGTLNLVINKPVANNAIVELNAQVALEATASASSNLEILVDGVSVKTETAATTISTTYTTTTSGLHEVTYKANDGTSGVEKKMYFYTAPTVVNEALPKGLVRGVNYDPNDATKATLVLFAPYKTFVFAVGDFNNWMLNEGQLMKKDGDYFWVKLENLTPNKEYVYQYFIDGTLKVADPYAEKISDPWNDKWINYTATVYPNLIAYPEGKADGTASVLETGRTKYNWSVATFDRPDINKMVIYELHFRDFTTEGTVNAARLKLDYLQNLGVNVIELMPFSEFEGNDSWGYNPSFYFAPDKAYGTREDYKAFIDDCHSRGIAVVQDMVLNHSYGESPFLKMYFTPDATWGKPAANSPWYNVNAPNTDYSWGVDFNHESIHTQQLVDSVCSFWIKEYKIDGFRFDFTKGFTNTVGNGWAYDQSRINILKRMADKIWALAPNDRPYVILEHLTDNSEETALANYGMLLWGNMNYAYNELLMGQTATSDIEWASYKKRGFTYPNLISYMESHDEERLVAKSLIYGNASSSSYNLTELSNAITRMEVAAAMFIPIPGPKMIWQFGELSYDISIDFNGRVGRKPVKWEYFDDPARRKVYDVYAALNKLKTTEPAFGTSDYDLNVGNWGQKRIRLRHADMDVVILANTGTSIGLSDALFTKTGTWYEYFSGTSLNVTNVNTDIEMPKGSYKIFTTKQLPKPIFTEIETVESGSSQIYPNPASDFVQIQAQSEVLSVELYNLLGRKVFEQTENLGTNPQINIQNLQNGIYILNVKTEQNGTTTSKLVINK